MHIKIVNRAYDDKGTECKERDIVLVQTKYMQEPGVAVITEIHATLITLSFDDRLIAKGPMSVRPSDITLFQRIGKQ